MALALVKTASALAYEKEWLHEWSCCCFGKAFGKTAFPDE
jgi:hypothetical protein